MHYASRFALAAACAATLLPGAAAAVEPAPLPLHAADPRAAVPATTYRPAIAWRPEAGLETSPDGTWLDNNATVAGYDSMSLTMKMRMKAPADPHAGHAGHGSHAGHEAHAGHGAAPAGPAPQHQESL